MKSEARFFADHVQALFGPYRCIRVVASERTGEPPICCFFFDDPDRAGVTIAVTYGLSLATHATWKVETPELVVCVRSTDESWGLAAASFAERLRGKEPFSEGSLLTGSTPLADESEMSGFLLCRQGALTGDQSLVRLESRTIRLRNAVPIYECEEPLIERAGFEAFLNRSADFLDVGREHIWEL